MATFTPPTTANDRGLQPGLWRKVPPPDRGVNVWINQDDSVDSGRGTISELSAARIVFYGGHTYTNVTAADAALLTAAGFTVS